MTNLSLLWHIQETQSSEASKWHLVAWVLGLAVLGTLVGASFWWVRRSQRLTKRGSRTLFPHEDTMCETRHPILGTATIRDMIELTTSGSGSGDVTSLKTHS